MFAQRERERGERREREKRERERERRERERERERESGWVCELERADWRVWVLNFQSCDDNQTVAHPSQSPPEKKEGRKIHKYLENIFLFLFQCCSCVPLAIIVYFYFAAAHMLMFVVSAIPAGVIGHTCTETNSDTDCGYSVGTYYLSCPSGATTCTCDVGYTGVAGGDCG